MSNNINTNTPLPTEATKAQGNPTGGTDTSPVGFQTGNGGNIVAILKLIEDLMKLYNYKNSAFVSQAQAESKMANDFSDSQIKLGDQEFTEQLIQGSFSMANGLFSAGLGIKGFVEEQNITPLEDDFNASKKFAGNLDGETDVRVQEEPIEMVDMTGRDVPEDVDPDTNRDNAKTRIDDMIEKLKTGEFEITDGKGNVKRLSAGKGRDGLSDHEAYKLSDDETKAKYKEAVQEQVDAKEAKLKSAVQKLQENVSKRQVWSTATGGISQGAGGIGAGIMKKQQAEQRADQTQYQTAQQQFQSLTRETESQGDKDLQTAESLTQLIPDIDKSNNAILSA